MMITRANEILPQKLIDELLRLSKLPRQPFIEFLELEDPKFSARFIADTWLQKIAGVNGSDVISMYAESLWLANGPKIIRPTPIDVEALSQIECRLGYADYTQPFPSLLVDFPLGSYFDACLCSKTEFCLSFQLLTRTHERDINTLISARGAEKCIEDSLVKFDEDTKTDAPIAAGLLRAAVNLCLLLSNHEIQTKILLEKEWENDSRLRKEKSARQGRFEYSFFRQRG